MGDGDHLVAIHDHLRGELAQLRELVEEVERGHLEAGGAPRDQHDDAAPERLDPRHLLPDLLLGWSRCTTRSRTRRCTRGAAPPTRPSAPHWTGWSPSTTRSTARWTTWTARVGLVADPDTGVDGVRRALDALSDALLEHLTYEESQLVEPLNRLGFGP